MNTIQTTTATNAQNPNHNKQTAICPHNQDGAIEVAKYIVGEIKRNVKSLVAQKIRYHNTGEIGAELQREFDKSNERIGKIKDPFEFGQPIRNPEIQRNPIISLKLWHDMVDTNKPWDHKWQIVTDEKLLKVTVHRLTPRGACSHSHYHKYKKFDYFYDIWSNIHYGYVGLSVGFSEQALLSGSWVQQVGSDIISAFKERRLPRADTLDDNTAMKIGFELYKKRGKFADKLTPEDMLYIFNTPQNQLPNSKQIHWCNNPSNPNRIKK
ncbi:hypothetical protein A9Z63_05345 [Moraxella lacunata]|uniref:Bacterial toxin 44 domain-containing protein n=3 Tax=Moraxellaceae TaxID=468 RepID=A0A1B8PWQ2_MORLA|nr:hypothetical protein A9309_10035 [Moraxella lacunata]OBX63433.1 hypothetical protein A9Z63_05345 [Moraxella lacunata]